MEIKKKRTAILCRMFLLLAASLFLFSLSTGKAYGSTYESTNEATEEIALEFAQNFANAVDPAENLSASQAIKLFNSDGSPIGWIVGYQLDGVPMDTSFLTEA